MPAPRWRPTASISSTKIRHGALALPCSKRSRTREAPTPTNISTKSEPLIEKKGTPASPATARAKCVLPVPGGPTIKTPLGIRPPRRWNRCGSLRNSMISSNSFLASSAPATSAKVALCLSSIRSLARLLPKENNPRAPPCICRNMNTQKAINSSHGKKLKRKFFQRKGSSSKRKSTPRSSHSRLVSPSIGPKLTTKRVPSCKTPSNSRSPTMTALAMRSWSKYWRYSL